jgi:hypothetical protein
LFAVASFFHATTRRSCSAKGRGRRSTASTTLKTAVLTPIPRVSATTATAVKAGFFHSMRTP